ncbi:TRAP transporter substrate-binding protein DctP [Mesorhizobium sp. CN2-181]|uniref:TRAP transporter substrate-binding protein DctP n=1 Tax=Mesorhizobium yinganensis TaxID=3157707 RepID=UPI0032B766A2
MGFKRILASLALVAGVLTETATAAELRVISSWDHTYPAYPLLLEQYTKNVEAASDGDIKFKISGPETVPSFEQLQPVGSGVFQLLFTHSAYHFGNTSFLMAVDGLKGDVRKWREAGLIELVDKHYERFNVKVIFMAKPPENSGYQIILRDPVTPAHDMNGRKIRGTQSYAGVLSMLGASPVVLPGSEIYTALEKGVIDGAAWPVIGVINYRWNEVARYLLRPVFGAPVHSLFINLDTWKALTPAQQSTLLEEGKKIEASWEADWLKLMKTEEAALIEKGAQITTMAPAQAEQLSAAYEEGLWDAALKKDPKDVADLKEFAKKNGLTN